jgi:ribosomal protein S18 acetylase RimI-like enzyme
MGALVQRSEPVRDATWDDFDAVAQMLARQSRAAGGGPAERPEFVRTEWELPSFQVGSDNWVVPGRGYAAVTPAGGLVLAARDETAADALLARAIQRARERGLASLQLAVQRGDEQQARLVRVHPFELVTDTWTMWRGLGGTEPGREWPAGITIRTFEPADASPVHALLDEAYRGWDAHYVPLSHDDWVPLMTGDIEFDPTVWWLAERDGGLAGCALWWSSGWLKDLAVRERERGRGLGGALVRAGLREFARRGMQRVGLKVDPANPTGAPQLYERLGFVTERREQVWALTL